jgi:Mrp family chromosome partitioning ATPase
VVGNASFGQIITRDRYSRVHVITAGKVDTDEAAIVGSQRLAVTLEALARSYDHVIVHAGSVPDANAERIAQLAPHAVLVTDPLDEQATALAQARLATAGFKAVSVLQSIPAAPQADAPRAAA